MKRALAQPSLPARWPAVELTEIGQAASVASLDRVKPPTGLLSRAWQWICSRQLRRADAGRLQVAETVSLGEKRFVAVVQVDGRHFLLAGGPANIALLAQLDEKEPFANVLQKTMTVAEEPITPVKSKKKSVPAKVAHVAPPAQRAPGKQKAKSSSKKTTPPLAAADSPSATGSTFGEVLNSAMRTVGGPVRKKAPARPTPPGVGPLPATVDSRLEGKTTASDSKMAAAVDVAAVAAARKGRPEKETGGEDFDQWLLEAALRQRSKQRLVSEKAKASTARRGHSVAVANEKKALDEWKEEPATDPLSLAIPLAPRSRHLTIEEYA